MKNKKFSLGNIIVIAAVVGITILTILEYLSIIGWVYLTSYAVFPYLVYKIAKKKNRNVFVWTIISILTYPLIVWIIINIVATNNERKKSKKRKKRRK
tara:strand:- start:59 stop:352 length:294 start_codon:yes stop_codon:yes gene_type:complete